MKYHYLAVRNADSRYPESSAAYGIAVVVKQDSCMCIHQLYRDICGDFVRIAELVRLCNDLYLDPLHLPEVIDDFLAEV